MSAPLRLLLLADSYWPIVGGGETHSRLLVSALAAKGVDVKVLTQHRLASSLTSEQVDGVPVYRVGKAGHKRFGKYLMIPAMVRWILANRSEYDVIYVCGLRILGLPAVWLGRYLQKPVVLRSESCEELSGLYIQEHLTGVKQLFRPIARWLVAARNKVLRKADAFLSISDAVTREFSSNGVADAKIVKIYNGIDMSVYSENSSDDRATLRKSLDLPDDAVLVTYTGKLNRGKGLEYLLQAWKILLASRTQNQAPLHLVLVGAGQHMYLSLEDQLRSFVNDHGLSTSVTFTGYTDRVVDYLHASDVFVMPSEMEALCISLIEALACALPSVATRVGGIPDVARHEQEALLVPPADASALAQALQILLDNPELASQLASRGKARAQQLFDIDKVADQHISLFSELVTARNRMGGKYACR